MSKYSFSCSVGSAPTCDFCDQKQQSYSAFSLNSTRNLYVSSGCRGQEERTLCQNYALEQFLVFAVAGKEELHLGKALSMGLVQKDFRVPMGGKLSSTFLTSVMHFKIFVSLRGNTPRRKFFSFYVRLLEDPSVPDIKIKPFPFSPVNSGFYFKSKLRFLTKKEVLRDVIDSKGASASFLKSQKMLPAEVLKKMIEKDYSDLRKGVRKLKL